MEVKDLLRVEYRGELVLSTQQLAVAYGCTIQNIRWNFADNKDKFIEGIHYFRIDGEELKAFKTYMNDLVMLKKASGSSEPAKMGSGETIPVIMPCTKMASSLMLWTRRGAVRHCKILNNERAWNMFNALEENYFSDKKPEFQPPISEEFTKREKVEMLFFLIEHTTDDALRDEVIRRTFRLIAGSW